MNKTGQNIILLFFRYITPMLFFCLFTCKSYAQYAIHYDDDYPLTLTYGPENHNGFRISASIVAFFTAGVADRNGFRLGAGITLSQTIDNWTLLSGLDVYKEKQQFGLGISYAGVVFDNGEYGASYYLNKYYQNGKQISGMISLHLDDFRINFEDDILSFPFVGFKIYDRYRTAALEIRYRGFMIGTNVYTTEVNGLTDISSENKKGVYVTGKQISSPVYIGYATNDLILRCGVNNKTGGLFGQNFWHQLFFDTPDFKYGDYNNQFIQLGVEKPYTLY